LREIGRPHLTAWLVSANRPHVLLDGALAHPNAQFQEFAANPFSTPQPIVLGHLPEEARWFQQRPSAHEKQPLTSVSKTGGRVPDAT
jgi:hypothetical protein